jgi:hypothetical protein
MIQSLTAVGAGLAATPRVLKNCVHRALGGSDHRRWADVDNLEQWWDERTARLAQLVPVNSHVIEFGAGRRRLESMLDKTCRYTPSDLVERGPGTLVCDLNGRPLPELKELSVTVALFGGVLEYVHDLDSLIEWLSKQVICCIASYTVAPAGLSVVGRIRDRFSRRYYGFMNCHSESELLALFERHGYRCEANDTWTTQKLYRFAKGSGS